MTHAHAPDAAAGEPVPPSRRLPPLTALRFSVVAARTGSSRPARAAEELCVTQGAVSRQVLLLEEFYGQALFLRQARGLVLTEAGQLLARTANAALEQIAQTTQVLRRRMEVREVRFMIPTCAMLWAMPLLMRFQARHPGFRIAVSTTLAHVLDEERFDAGIVYERLDTTLPRHRLLFAERLTPVCSPRLLQGAQALRTPQDLARCVLLHARPDHQDWRLWLDAAQLDEIVSFLWPALPDTRPVQLGGRRRLRRGTRRLRDRPAGDRQRPAVRTLPDRRGNRLRLLPALAREPRRARRSCTSARCSARRCVRALGKGRERSRSRSEPCAPCTPTNTTTRPTRRLRSTASPSPPPCTA